MLRSLRLAECSKEESVSLPGRPHTSTEWGLDQWGESLSSGGWKAKAEVLAGLVSSEASLLDL